MATLLASLDDINAELPSDEEDTVVQATDENTALIQITAARIIRGYLARIIDNVVIMGWSAPESTPDIIRTIAAKLIAAQLYINRTAAQSMTIEDNNFAQRKYNEAMAILNGIISGEVVIDDTTIVITDRISTENFWPIDSTDRAFTLSQLL